MKIKKVCACASCGSSIPEDCKFCPKCGTEVAPQEPEVEVLDKDEDDE
jgi:rRNA maturation endonuclease Nob1